MHFGCCFKLVGVYVLNASLVLALVKPMSWFCTVTNLNNMLHILCRGSVSEVCPPLSEEVIEN